MVAQYSTPSNGAAGILIVWLLVLGGLAFIPAVIASNKGHSGMAYYFFGLFFFLPALIVALAIPASARSRDENESSGHGVPIAPSVTKARPVPSPPASPEPRTVSTGPEDDRHPRPKGGRVGLAPPPGPGVVRECPYCKEGMRRDASVCPHCRRESPPWVYAEGLWWVSKEDGHDVWLDEASQTWWASGEAPDPHDSETRYMGEVADWPQPMPVATEALKFLYMAGKYRLGYSAQGYAAVFIIWDDQLRQLSQFPFTGVGWPEAFQALESLGGRPHFYKREGG
jgi:hypothetical protein